MTVKKTVSEKTTFFYNKDINKYSVVLGIQMGGEEIN